MPTTKLTFKNWGLKRLILIWMVPLFLFSAGAGVLINYMMAQDAGKRLVDDHIIQRRMDLKYIANLPTLAMYIVDRRLGLNEEAAFFLQDIQGYLSTYMQELKPSFSHTLLVVSQQGEELLRIENGAVQPTLGGYPAQNRIPALKSLSFGQEPLVPTFVNRGLASRRMVDVYPLYDSINRVLMGGLVYEYEVPVKRLQETSRQVLWFNIAWSALSSILLFGLFYLILDYFTRPLRELTHSVQTMMEGDLGRPVPSGGKGETRVLSTSFEVMRQRLKTSFEEIREANEALEARVNLRTRELQATNQSLKQSMETLEETRDQLVQSEKMAALGGLVAGVAHEINTPVGIAVTAASALLDESRAVQDRYKAGDLTEEAFDEYLQVALQFSQAVLSNLHRASGLVKSFKQVAVDQSNEERRSFALRPYIEDLLVSLKPQFKRRGVLVDLRGDRLLKIESYPGAWSQILTNLVFNSLRHGFEPGQGGRISIEFEASEGGLNFTYADDGKGIAPEHLDKVFEPFFTTRRGDGGSGLGLHLLYSLVTQQLGGTIRCTSTIDEGAVFNICIPTLVATESLHEDVAQEPTHG